jgi:hypothetical protein
LSVSEESDEARRRRGRAKAPQRCSGCALTARPEAWARLQRLAMCRAWRRRTCWHTRRITHGPAAATWSPAAPAPPALTPLASQISVRRLRGVPRCKRGHRQGLRSARGAQAGRRGCPWGSAQTHAHLGRGRGRPTMRHACGSGAAPARSAHRTLRLCSPPPPPPHRPLAAACRCKATAAAQSWHICALSSRSGEVELCGCEQEAVVDHQHVIWLD